MPYSSRFEENRYENKSSLEHFLEDITSFVRNYKRQVITGTIVGALLLTGISAYQPIGQQNRGVVTRLGQYHRTLDPGPHFIIPFAEDIEKPNVQQAYSVEIGFRTVEESKAGKPAVYKDAKNDDEMRHEAQMLTADENLVWVSMIVNYKVHEGKVTDYVYNVSNVEKTIQEVGQAVLRQAVGDYGVDEVITFGRGDIESTIKNQFQTQMDNYNSGIDILQIQLQNTQPPEAEGTVQGITVQSAFRGVETAMQKKEQMINDARAYENMMLANAQGDAAKIIAQAQQFQATRIGEAKGDVAEYMRLKNQHDIDPEGTKSRPYYETMEKIYPKLEEIIIDKNVGEGGLLQFLNLRGE